MVTYASTYKTGYQKDGRFRFDFTGLSGDEKPTEEFEGIGIGNGSSFMEIDTMNVFLYDQENETWR